MSRKSSKQLARDMRLAAAWEKRWPKEPAKCSGPEPAPPFDDSAAFLQALSISDNQFATHENEDRLGNDAPETPNEPAELSEVEMNPEDLPFEDPISEMGGSEDGISDNDGWWEEPGAGEVSLGQDEDVDIRIDNQPLPVIEQDKIITELEKIVRNSYKGQGKARRSTFDELTLSRIRLMLMALRLSRELDCGLIRGSVLAAVAVGRAQRVAVGVRRWIRDFWRTQQLPANLYGTWNESIIEDEDFRDAVLQHLRRVGRYAGPQDIIKFFNTPEAKPFSHLLDEQPSIRTAQRWMPILGYKWRTERRGQFADGHEREDVVDFRMNNFIPKWTALEPRMRKWDREGNEIPPDLRAGEREVVVHWHDEVIYRAHDRRMTRWIPDGEAAGIYKKGEGQSLMIAHMISAKYGFLERLGAQQADNTDKVRNKADDAMVIFRPGKERDGYFCNHDVCEQVKGVMEILDEYPANEEHILVFDNATTHTKLPDDAPVVTKMTLGPSFK
ncbi:unnamed protein product, partial [Rhizoctonia solani]